MAERRAGLKGSVAGPVAYGLTFMVGVPVLLWAWARATAEVVGLPAYRSLAAGLVLLEAGLALAAAGAWTLWHRGGGLPMNPYPPPRYVASGVYRYLAHPIYVGFGLCVAGVSLAVGTASGLWLATPVTALGMAVLVVGFEGPDLRRRFGDALHRPRLSLPRAGAAAPTGWERVSVYLLVLLPWLVVYEAVQLMGVPPDALDSHLPFEAGWPVLEWTEAVYASVYLLVVVTPLVARTGTALRRFALAGLFATAVVTLIYLVVPLVAPPRPFEPTTWLGRRLAEEQAFNNTVAAFPAFHVLWAFIAADAWPGRWRRLAWPWAVLIAASCLTTGMHSVADVVLAVALFPLFRSPGRVREALRRGAEAVANSWREWRVGRLRVINHGFYGGLGGAVGLALAGSLAGPDQLGGVALASLASLIGAGLWAQWLEGSSVLLRPFGFYGGLVGAVVGAALAGLLGYAPLVVLGALAVALPWAQAIGRLRCLVQGCCHGGPASAALGIRYRHPRSRVTRIAGLAGVPLHPTPLYSILGNVVAGLLLLRLWSLGPPPAFVFGMGLIFSGLVRFVEESFRAEPQTPQVAGLHIYHWLAIASVVAGIAVSGVESLTPRVAFHPLTPGLVGAAVGLGVLAAFAMGVDFPASNRPFSRLAAADDTASPTAREP